MAPPGRTKKLLALLGLAPLAFGVVAEAKAHMKAATGTSQLFDEPCRPNEQRMARFGTGTTWRRAAPIESALMLIFQVL
jgi:hypothetical protein